MHLHPHRAATPDTHTDFLRRYARGMLRCVHSDQPSKALPIVRRVHAAAATGSRVTELYHARTTCSSSTCSAPWPGSWVM